MMKTFRLLLMGTLCIAIGCTLIFGVSYGSYTLHRHFAPKYEEVRREVYEESKSYKDGMQRDIENLRIEYLRAETDALRAALRATILHRVADYPVEELTDELRVFVRELKNEGTRGGM